MQNTKNKVQSLDLVWIAVQDLKQAIQFYTETVGLKVMEVHEQFGWAELQGHDGGARLGIAQIHEENGFKPGQNACATFTVENIEQSKEELENKGAQCIGNIQTVPGHVKILTVKDKDNNCFQIVQKLSETE
jgi:predicted enzyme related to lactoylglutathione lyase